ncbi:hypothetical protein ABS693_004736 [Escherichia coli]
MKRLFIATGFLCLCGSAVAQTVITVEPSNKEYKFVWSDSSAVFKTTDGSNITVRCQYAQGKDGVDDDAKPYTSNVFKCDNGTLIALKQIKGSNDTVLIVASGKGEILAQDVVSLEKASY